MSIEVRIPFTVTEQIALARIMGVNIGVIRKCAGKTVFLTVK